MIEQEDQVTLKYPKTGRASVIVGEYVLVYWTFTECEWLHISQLKMAHNGKRKEKKNEQ